MNIVQQFRKWPVITFNHIKSDESFFYVGIYNFSFRTLYAAVCSPTNYFYTFQFLYI